MIFSIIDEKYSELDEGTRKELLTFIHQNLEDRSIVYFISRFSRKDYSFIELGREILSKDINREHNHGTYFNIGLALLLKNAKDGMVIEIGAVDKNNVQNARIFLEIAYEMDKESVEYLSALSIALILLGDLNQGIVNAKLALKKNEQDANALNAIAVGYILKKNFNAALPYLEKLSQIKPDTVPSLINLGNVYKGLKMYDEALEVFERANRLKPDTDYIIAEMGVAHQNLGNVDDALKNFENAIELNPVCELAWLGKGDLYFNLTDIPKAVESYEKAAQINGNNPNVWVALAQSYDRLKDHEKAERCIEKAIEKKPTSEYGILGIGVFYANRRMIEECEKWCGEIIKENPKNIKALECIGVAYNNAKKFEKAIEFFNRALDIDPTQPNIICEKAVSVNALKNAQEAKKLYNEALKLDPNNARALLELSKILTNEGNYDEALEHLSHAEKISPAESEILFVEGVIYANKREYGMAIELLERFIKLNPEEHIAAYFYIAEAYRLSGDHNESIRYYEKFLEFEPNNRGAILGLSGAHISSGKMPIAKKHFKKLMRESNGDPQVPFEISIILSQCGKLEEAIYYLNKAIDADPKKDTLHIEKANIYRKLGKRDEANKSYEKALILNPKNPTVLYQIGINYLAKDNPRKAAEFLEKYTAIVQNNAIGWFYLGNANNKIGNKIRAKECFEHALRYGLTDAEMFAVIGDFYSKTMHDLNNAISCYEKAILLGRKDSRIKLVLAGCYLNIRKFDECIRYCKDILNNEPENIEALAIESIALVSKEQYDIAEENLRKALLLKPNNYLAMLGLAFLYNNKGQSQEAIDWAKKSIEKEPHNPNNIMLYFIAGNNYNLIGKYEEAIANFELARKYKPDYPDVLKLGGFPFRNLKRYKEAIEWWKEYLKLMPEDEEFWYYTGVTYGDIDDFKNGIECLERAISLKDDEKAPYYAIGVQYSNSGNQQKAIQIFQKLKALDSESSEPLLYTGDIYFNVTNEFDKAIGEYLDAMNINPNNWKVWANLSIASRILGDMAKGKEYQKKALQQYPNKVEIFTREIGVFLRTSRIDDAKQSVEDALIEFPENGILWFLKACIASVSKDLEESIKALEKAINLNPECIPFALAEPNLEYLRMQESFTDLIDKHRRLGV